MALISLTFSGSGLLGQQGSGVNDFLGELLPGDNLILVRADSLTLLFSQGISSVGAQIASNFYGPFTGTITAYDGAILLGSYTENGDSTNSNDGTAIFLGFADLSAPDITSVVFTYTAGAPQGFILDTLQMNDPLPVITPEPGKTLSLGLFGLVGLMLWHRRTLPTERPATASFLGSTRWGVELRPAACSFFAAGTIEKGLPTRGRVWAEYLLHPSAD